MPSPVPVNTTAATVNTAIDGVFSVGVVLAETSLKTAVPFLGWPIIGTVVNWAIELISNKVYQYFSLFVTFEIISIQTSAQVSESQKALAALKAAQKKGDQNEISVALKNFKTATTSLTHWNGSANPGSL